MKHEVHLPQGTIRYREDGTGEPLLFVHGVVVNGSLWRKVVPQLSKDFRCIVPDWPLGAHEVPMSADADLSPPALAKLVVDFMDALGLESATLVGNDTGGASASSSRRTIPTASSAGAHLVRHLRASLRRPSRRSARSPGSRARPG